MTMLRVVAAYAGFIILATLFATSLGLLMGEFFRPSGYSNYIGFWSFTTGLFGSALALVAKHVFRREY